MFENLKKTVYFGCFWQLWKNVLKNVVLVVLINVASIDEDSVFCRACEKVAKRAENSLFYELFNFFSPNLLTTVSLLVLLDVVEDSLVQVNLQEVL